MSLDWVNVAAVAVASVNVGVTVYIAVTVRNAGRKVVAMEQDRAIKEAWIQIDQTALSNSDDLSTLDQMFHPDRQSEDMPEKRKRWLAYMVLNPLEAAWSAAQQKNMPDGANKSSEGAMRNLVRDKGIAELIQEVVYGEAFKQRCKDLREEYVKQQANPASPSGSADRTTTIDANDLAAGIRGA